MVCFFEFLTNLIWGAINFSILIRFWWFLVCQILYLGGHKFLNSNPLLMDFSAPDTPVGEVQILFEHQKQWNPPLGSGLPSALKCSVTGQTTLCPFCRRDWSFSPYGPTYFKYWSVVDPSEYRVIGKILNNLIFFESLPSTFRHGSMSDFQKNWFCKSDEILLKKHIWHWKNRLCNVFLRCFFTKSQRNCHKKESHGHHPIANKQKYYRITTQRLSQPNSIQQEL